MYNLDLINLQDEVSEKAEAFLNCFREYYLTRLADMEQYPSFLDDVMKHFYVSKQGIDLRLTLDRLNEIKKQSTSAVQMDSAPIRLSA